MPYICTATGFLYTFREKTYMAYICIADSCSHQLGKQVCNTFVQQLVLCEYSERKPTSMPYTCTATSWTFIFREKTSIPYTCTAINKFYYLH